MLKIFSSENRAVYEIIWKKKKHKMHCCVSNTTIVTRTLRNVILYVHCLSFFVFQLRFPWEAGNFVTRCVNISFWRTYLFRDVTEELPTLLNQVTTLDSCERSGKVLGSFGLWKEILDWGKKTAWNCWRKIGLVRLEEYRKRSRCLGKKKL